MDTITLIASGVQSLIPIIAGGMSIIDRLNKGELTDDEARLEWEKTRSMWRAGADAIDVAAGRKRR
jgi:hypothetical protein